MVFSACYTHTCNAPLHLQAAGKKTLFEQMIMDNIQKVYETTYSEHRSGSHALLLLNSTTIVMCGNISNSIQCTLSTIQVWPVAGRHPKYS